MKPCLPDVLETAKNFVSTDTGNLFPSNLLLPKTATKRIEAQKEVYVNMIESQTRVVLAKQRLKKILCWLKWNIIIKSKNSNIIC